MMESSESKKSIFYMVVLILTLITMIIGATLAYFKLLYSELSAIILIRKKQTEWLCPVFSFLLQAF